MRVLVACEESQTVDESYDKIKRIIAYQRSERG